MGQTMFKGRDSAERMAPSARHNDDDNNNVSFLSRLRKLFSSIFRRCRKPPPDPTPVYIIRPPINFRAYNAPPFSNNQHCVVEIEKPVVITTGTRAVENEIGDERAIRSFRGCRKPSPFSTSSNNQHCVVENKKPVLSNTEIRAVEKEIGIRRSAVVEQPRPLRPVENQRVENREQPLLIPLPQRRSTAEIKKKASLGPYSSEQRILVVGDGDFSFSASLAVAFGDASSIVATSLDSYEFLMRNYNKASTNITSLTSRSSKVIHGVDATKMARHPQLCSLKFDRIVYNFPHAGFANRNAARQLQISENQVLVKGFLENAKKMIKEEDGQIHVAHKCRGFYLEWNLVKLGTNVGLRLVEESHFDYRLYPGYATKYGFGGDANFNCYPSKSYKFQLSN